MTRSILSDGLRLLAITAVWSMPPCAAAVEATAPPRSQPARPNFVFILADDLGYGDLGCNGSPIIRTPHLDRLAAEGMRLTHCYAAAPVCSPARAGIITGRNPNRSGIRDWIPQDTGIHLPTSEPSVARLLKAAGYATCHVGKWHLASRMDGTEPTPAGHGFDHWFATQNNAHPSHENPDNFVRNGTPVGPIEGWSSTIIVDEAIGWLRDRRGGPFCLFVWFHAPHEPIVTPQSYQDLYPGYDDPTRPIYYGCVSMLDAEVGRLLATLDDMGLRERTLVMFTSDNGPETLRRYRGAERSHGSPGGLRGMKLHVYEGGYRVPGIIRWPGRTQPGQTCDEPINGTDILPTFCEIAGVELAKDAALDGASILPIFRGEPVRRTRPLYWQYDRAIGGPNRVTMLAEGSWKLLADAELRHFELYDLSHDPGERQDLGAAHPDRVNRLADRMRGLHREINHP